MNVKQLEKYPRLETVLAPSFRNRLKYIFEDINPKVIQSRLNVYSLFIAITESESNYTGLNILNSGEKINHQLQSYAGFIYSGIIELGEQAKYQYVKTLQKAFFTLAKQNQLTIQPISISSSKITDDIQQCKQYFNLQFINKSALTYYSGWTCHSKEGQTLYLHLAPFRDHFGKELTETVHEAIFNYAKTQKTTTSKNTTKDLVNILNLLPMHCSTPEQLEQQLQSHCSVWLMEEVMLNYFSTGLIKGNDTKTLIAVWRTMISAFTQCFIETGILPSPETDFIVPEWREPVNSQHSISIGGDFSEVEIDRWLVNIPLSIKDEQALNVIHHRLNQDLKHIRIKSHEIVVRVKQLHERNKNYIENGIVKSSPTEEKKSKHTPIGPKHLANTVATFYNYGIKGTANYLNFLGFHGQSVALTEVLNLPSLKTLNAFVSLLVLEHPKITPAWIEQWELFDKNGNQVGFFQSRKQWIIKSLKNRRGATLAQQEILLNSYSKNLVNALIEHTEFARSTLKKQGDNNYRFMMLTCPSATKDPKRYAKLGASLINDRRYHQQLAVASFDPTPPNLPFVYQSRAFSKINHIHPRITNRLLTQIDADGLAQIVTPRAIRKSRGLQIYLETRSLRAVSEALGHNNVNTELLGKYLPAPLTDFFNTRWVRQFQNAIIYEALKDSLYLFDALDFDENKLSEFLSNHGLGTLHDHLTQAKEEVDITSALHQPDSIDELVFTLSTPLFQVLIALQQLVTSAHLNDIFKPVVKDWFEVAEFILNQFSTTGKSRKYYKGDKECEELYHQALANPLPLPLFKEVLLCR